MVNVLVDRYKFILLLSQHYEKGVGLTLEFVFVNLIFKKANKCRLTGRLDFEFIKDTGHSPKSSPVAPLYATTCDNVNK